MAATIAEQNAATTPAAVQANLARLERAAAAAPAHRLDPPHDGELIDDLHQMVLGGPVRLRDLINGGQAIGIGRQVHQHTQSVISIKRQSHKDVF